MFLIYLKMKKHNKSIKSNLQSKPSRLTVIVKTTHDCNLGCVYCYTNPNAEKGIMDSNDLFNMINKISENNREAGSSHLIWHGGEPLLPGIDFYKEIINIQENVKKIIKGHKYRNSIQTNGTLLNSEFLDFFQEQKFKIGLSLDGNEYTHNLNRHYKDGSTSFDDVFSAITELKKRKMGRGVICVLNKNTASNLKEIYRFFKDNEIYPQMNVQIPSGRALDNKELGLTPREFGESMIKLFDMWFYDNSKPIIEIDPFADIIKNLSNYRNKNKDDEYPTGCSFRNNCANSFISVTPGGNVYPCGRFAGDSKFYMGNINKGSIEEILSSDVHQKFLKRHDEGIKSCKPCEYKPICNSGCPDNAFLFHENILTKDGYCEGYKMLFKYIENAVKKQIGVNMKNG